jgi:hypothetical protein
MDDYFYPYRIAGKEFPDQKTFEQYGGTLKKDDWRRSNCDSIIVQLYRTIRSTNPRVKFGISPFGVWRNKSKDPMGSDSKAGQTNYDDLYADILLWLKKGWIDYVLPQLYWEIGHKLCDYNTLLDWWSNNSYGKHVYIGHGIYRAGTNAAWKDANELPTQIRNLRINAKVQGSAYFSSKSFEKNPNGWNDSLQNNYYKTPALVPPMYWIDSIAPIAPTLVGIKDERDSKSKEILLTFAITDSVEAVNRVALFISNDPRTLGKKIHSIHTNIIKGKVAITLPTNTIPTEWKECFIAASNVDGENNESPTSNYVSVINTGKGWTVPR